jgi:hypothetical protein
MSIQPYHHPSTGRAKRVAPVFPTSQRALVAASLIARPDKPAPSHDCRR